VVVVVVIIVVSASLDISEYNPFLEVVKEEFVELVAHGLVAGVLGVRSLFEAHHKDQGQVVVAGFEGRSPGFVNFEHSDPALSLLHL
jgi:hypothetical protein